MAEPSVTVRARRQGARLAKLRERRSISKGRLMDHLGFKTSRAYDLYEEGTSVIRLDRLEDWASAFEMPVLAFVAVIVTGEPDPELVRLATEALGPEGDARTADTVARGLSAHDTAVQDEVLGDMPEAIREFRLRRQD